ncbi:hypothetical protein D3C72_557380 [compost metagenome]
MSEGQYMQVIALGIGQHQSLGDAIQHIRRGRTATTLFQPGIPGRTYVGALGNLFPAQARCAAAADGKTEGCGIKPQATIAQEGAECIVRHCISPPQPVENYTMIRSLL